MQPLSDIKRMRMRIGLTQSQLAQAAGVSQSLIAKIEAGSLDPGYTKACHIFDTISSLSDQESPTAGDLMVRKIHRVAPTEKVQDVISLMRKHGISQMPVIDGSSVVGLLSETSVLESVSRGVDLKTSAVSDIMQDAPPVISPDVPVHVVMDLLKLSSLALIAQKGEFKGVITRTDLLKYLER